MRRRLQAPPLSGLLAALAALLALAAPLSACSLEGADGLTWRESWELLAITDDGEVVDLAMTRANTGLLRGQGHTRVGWIGGRRGSVDFRRRYAPVQVEVDETSRDVRMARDRFSQPGEGEDWTIEIRHLEMSLVAHLEDQGDPVPALAARDDDGLQVVEALLPGGDLRGWLETGERGGMLDGRGVIFHRFGDRWPPEPRQTVVLLSKDFSIGVDLQGGRTLLWAEVEGRILEPAGVRLTVVDGKPVVVDFRPQLDLQARLRRRRPVHEVAVLDGLSGAEQAALEALGHPLRRRVQGGVAEVLYEGRRLIGRGAVVEVDTSPPGASASASASEESAPDGGGGEAGELTPEAPVAP